MSSKLQFTLGVNAMMIRVERPPDTRRKLIHLGLFLFNSKNHYRREVF